MPATAGAASTVTTSSPTVSQPASDSPPSARTLPLHTEIAASWQGEDTEVGNGEVLTAVVQVNTNLPEGQDAAQESSQRSLLITTTNAYVRALPAACDSGTISTDHASLTCVLNTHAHLGQALALEVPLRARAEHDGDLLTLTATDEAGHTASPPPVPVRLAERLNVTTDVLSADRQARLVSFGLGVWLAPGSAAPAPGTAVHFDAVLEDERGDVSRHLTDPVRATTGVPASARLFAASPHEHWSVTRDGATFHVTVTSQPDASQETWTNGEAANGATAYASALMTVPIDGELTLPAVARLRVSNLRYTSSLTGREVSEDYVTDDNEVTTSVWANGTVNSHIGQYIYDDHWFDTYVGASPWNPDLSMYAAAATSPWSGTSRVLPGGLNTQLVQTNLGPHAGPLTLCWILPAGQGAHYTGSVGYLAEQFTGSGRLEYYSGPMALSDTHRCADSSGWSSTAPSDLGTLTGVRLSGLAPAPGRVSQFAAAQIAVDDDVPAGRWIYTNGAVITGDGALLTIPVDEPGTDPDDDGAGPYLNGTVDAFKVASARAYTTTAFSADNVRAGTTVTVSGTYQVTGIDAAGGGPVASQLTLDLPAGLDYVPGSAQPGQPLVSEKDGAQTLRWTVSDPVGTRRDWEVTVATTGQATGTLRATMTQELASSVSAGGALGTHRSHASIAVTGKRETILTKTADADTIALTHNAGHSAWSLRVLNDTAQVQDVMDVIDVLPFRGDARNTHLTGRTRLTAISPAAGSQVWLTSAPAPTLTADPAHPSNSVDGRIGAPSPLWTRWDGSPGSLSGVTAVRFVSRKVEPLAQHTHRLSYEVQGVAVGDRLVNSAVARATLTGLRMVESADAVTVGRPSPIQVLKEARSLTMPVAVGRTLSYTVTVAAPEDGNGDTNVVVTDLGGPGLGDVHLSAPSQGTLSPDGSWAVGTLLAGQQATVTATATVTDDYDGSPLTNTVVVEGDHTHHDGPDCQDNDTVGADTDACDLVTIEENSVLRVDKTLDPDGGGVEPGGTARFIVTVRTDDTPGAGTAADVIVTDLGGHGLADPVFTEVSTGRIDETGRWRVGDLQPGQVERAIVTATVEAGASGEIDNRVIVFNPRHPRSPASALEECVVNSGDVSTDDDQCDVVRVALPGPGALARTGPAAGALGSAAVILVLAGAITRRRSRTRSS